MFDTVIKNFLIITLMFFSSLCSAGETVKLLCKGDIKVTYPFTNPPSEKTYTQNPFTINLDPDSGIAQINDFWASGAYNLKKPVKFTADGDLFNFAAKDENEVFTYKLLLKLDRTTGVFNFSENWEHKSVFSRSSQSHGAFNCEIANKRLF